MGFDLFQKYWLNNAGIHSTVALMYHSISAKGSSLGWRGVVSLPRFRTQLDLLNTEGRQTVCICDLTLNNRLPESNIVITFYDGYVDNLTFCKELAKRGMHATCFIVSGSIGREPAWHTDEYPDVRLFNAAKLHNMQSTNMKVGSPCDQPCSSDGSERYPITCRSDSFKDDAEIRTRYRNIQFRLSLRRLERTLRKDGARGRLSFCQRSPHRLGIVRW